MSMQEIRKNAKEKLKGFCRVCSVCDGKVCAGEVPGMGGLSTGTSFKANLEALAKVKLKMKTIHGAKDPSTKTSLFGQEFATPIQGAPMTGTTYNMGGAVSEEDFISYVVEGSLKAGSIGWTGDGADPTMYDSGLKAVKVAAGKAIPIIKPRAQEEIIKRIKAAEEAGALAVGVDIDGAGLVTMALKGQPVGPKTFEELKEIVSSTKLPFILKGIMTVEEAKLAVEIGAAAIVVSNHGGRVLDHTHGAAQVLSTIADAVKGKVIIFADGGVRTGSDVLKLLALGADGVLVGRPLITGAFGGAVEGVEEVIKTLTKELYQAMILTGCNSIADINSNILEQ